MLPAKVPLLRLVLQGISFRVGGWYVCSGHICDCPIKGALETIDTLRTKVFFSPDNIPGYVCISLIWRGETITEDVPTTIDMHRARVLLLRLGASGFRTTGFKFTGLGASGLVSMFLCSRDGLDP